jgi:hypothetical protein
VLLLGLWRTENRWFLKTLGIFIILFVLNSLKARKALPLITKWNIYLVLWWFLSGLFATGGPIYVMIIKKKTISNFRATMFAGISDCYENPYFSIWGIFCHGTKFTILYMCFFLYSLYFLGKSVFKIRWCPYKKIILGLLFISGAVDKQ